MHLHPVWGASVFFYPQLDEGGQVKVRIQKTPDSGIVSIFQNGVEVDQIDLYADPGVNPTDITLLTQPPTDPGTYELELRVTGGKNLLSSGILFYFRGSVVVFSRTDLEALTLSANYLLRVAQQSGDGSFADSHDSSRINFDANALYACMGLLAAHRVIGNPDYLNAVRDFLTWFAGMQMNTPGVPFADGAWNIGYRRNSFPPPDYLPAIAPYDAQGISEIRWVDAVQCLPTFVLWWYVEESGDIATQDSLLPVFKKGLDGFIRNNYDAGTGFFYSSWQHKDSPTIFLYHDAIDRKNSSGSLIEQHNDSEELFFEFSPTGAWGAYGPTGAVGSNEHYTLIADSFVQFSLSLDAGDQVYWLTQTAWDTGIATIQVATDGTNFTVNGTVDCYSATLLFQQSFLIYAAPVTGTYWFRIKHSGTINPAGAVNIGWQRLQARYSAGQTDVSLGLMAAWLMTRKPRYAQLAARMIRRFDDRFWSEADGRWMISLEGSPPGEGNNAWYPFPHGYTAFGQGPSRYFQPRTHFAEALESLDPFQDEEGGFLPPGFLEAEHIFSAFYLLGENQLPSPSNADTYLLAKNYIKSGQYFLTIDDELVAGVVFSKRYPYLYTNIAAFSCIALAGAITLEAGQNPIDEQLKFNNAGLWMRPS